MRLAQTIGSTPSMIGLLALALLLMTLSCQQASGSPTRNVQQDEDGTEAASNRRRSQAEAEAESYGEAFAVDPEFNALTGGDEGDNESAATGNNGGANGDEDAADLPETAASNLNWASGDPRLGLDSNIANAKISLSANDMATAAGHHHHHKHYVHGKLEMGAHTKKKGAFGWHAKYPVGGKGRR